jgi:hypothetical protein
VAFCLVTAVTTPLAVALLYSIIWFEKNGTDTRRTLVNRLVAI